MWGSEGTGGPSWSTLTPSAYARRRAAARRRTGSRPTRRCAPSAAHAAGAAHRERQRAAPAVVDVDPQGAQRVQHDGDGPVRAAGRRRRRRRRWRGRRAAARSASPCRPARSRPSAPCRGAGVTDQSARGVDRAPMAPRAPAISRCRASAAPGVDAGAVGQRRQQEGAVGQRLRPGQLDSRVHRPPCPRGRPQVGGVGRVHPARLPAGRRRDVSRWTWRRASSPAWPDAPGGGPRGGRCVPRSGRARRGRGGPRCRRRRASGHRPSRRS